MKKILCLLFILLSFSFASHSKEKQQQELTPSQKRIHNQKEFSHYAKLSKENDPEALFKLGKYYYEGRVVKKSYTKALAYLEQSSDLGYKKATYNLGILYANNKTPYHSYSKSFNIFIELAEEGNAAAQNRIGMFLTLGLGGPVDFKEAVKWYEKSSKQGYLTAQCNLASMYAGGMGVFTNFGRAHAFAKKGKSLNHPICVKVWRDYNLGKYEKDKGFKFKFYNQP